MNRSPALREIGWGFMFTRFSGAWLVRRAKTHIPPVQTSIPPALGLGIKLNLRSHYLAFSGVLRAFKYKNTPITGVFLRYNFVSFV